MLVQTRLLEYLLCLLEVLDDDYCKMKRLCVLKELGHVSELYKNTFKKDVLKINEDNLKLVSLGGNVFDFRVLKFLIQREELSDAENLRIIRNLIADISKTETEKKCYVYKEHLYLQTF